jgi:O-antigen ligase
MTLPKSQRRLIFLSVGAFALLMGIVVILGSAGLAERLHTEGLALHHRWIMYQLALQAFWDRPWQGTGLGTFSHIIAMYRQENLPIWSIWDKAHNTYLELLVELGWPATMALIGSMVWIISQCMRGIVIRRRNGMYPALAVAASAMLGLHALLDFSLQISGVTIPYLALLGVGYAQAFSSTDKRFSDSTTQSRAVDPLRKHHSIDAIYQKPPA